MSAIKLMLVEDDNEARKVTGLIMARKFPDIAIFLAENGSMGLELFKEHLPDIVMTDINMPVMDGIRMASEIKAIKPDTKFILLTATSKDNERFCEIGFSACIMKPLALIKLYTAIEKCVAEIMAKRSLKSVYEEGMQ
jgi:YesN/AraC family two-component response regulator